MRSLRLLTCYAVPGIICFNAAAQTAFFTAPDTVCVNTPVTITNTSTNASSYYWNFCVADIANQVPAGTNLGNVGNVLAQPVFVDLVYDADNKKYYGFLVNHLPGGLVRLDFGNSMLNTPTAVNLGNFGGALNTGAGSEGIQVVKANGKWYALIVGGYPPTSGTPRLVKVDFGANLDNPSPVAVNWGNIGGMAYAIDLYLFQEGAKWFGLTVNSADNTVTRFDFGTSFDNIPTAINLGNPGGVLNFPTGIHAINNNGTWHVFVTNDNTISTLARLDFGNSLLNTPVGTNLGTLGNVLHSSRDLTIMKFCDKIIGFIVNGHTAYNDIIRLDFNNDLLSAPAATSLGNIGTLSFPHSLSKLFRVGDDLYTLITNVNNNTVTRIRFAGCTSASAPGSTAATPPPVTYSQPGTYNINLTIDEGLPSQTTFCKQVVVIPPPVHTPTQSVVLCPGSSKKIGTGTKPATYQWNTGVTTDSIDVSQNGIYWVDINTGSGCNARDSFVVTTETADFSFTQDACNPLSLQFKDETGNSATSSWDFGNGVTAGIAIPSIIYGAYGDYTVTLTAQTITGCNVAVSKQIPVRLYKEDIVTTVNTTLCAASYSQIPLNAVPALKYCWTPATYLNDATIANPISTAPHSITYYLNAQTTGSNLIVNGDFSAGNTGFTSQYTYKPPPSVLQGEYYVGTNSQTWNVNLASCGDHTTGKGNMLLVNGAPDLNVKIWQQTVNVTPNTTYVFSTWIESIFTSSPAQLQFSINDKNLGNTIAASSSVCSWSQFYTTWNSGNNTTATIAIVNRNTAITGNDFALDDISFAPLITKQDSVVITINPKPDISYKDTVPACKALQLLAQPNGHPVAITNWTWDFGDGTGYNNAVDITHSYEKAGNYLVKLFATDANGCKDTVSKTIPIDTVTAAAAAARALICPQDPVMLSATGGSIYTWTPSKYLNNSSIATPVATLDSAHLFQVTVENAIGCRDTASVWVNVLQRPAFRKPADQDVCSGSAVQLVHGNDPSFIYQWTPATYLDNVNAASPVASPDVNMNYAVYIEEPMCHYDTTFNVAVIVHQAPVVVAQKANDIDCMVTLSQLNASGASSYAWSPGSLLDFPNRSNPVAFIDSTTTFYVLGTDSYGCSAIDSVTVNVSATGIPVFSIPNAFTPNGDGKNDCFGIKRWGRVKLKELAVFNRWGQKVFSTTDPSGCWDGSFNGVPQPTSAYVYVIVAETFCGTIKRTGSLMLVR
ncbi:MAG: PKD domain-containing protein [Chitinophagaceae bacterium]